MDRKPNYWCTWNTQNILSKETAEETVSTLSFAGDQGAKLARSMLHEKILFGENGMLNRLSDCCSDLYFMLDDGWDVPYGIHPDENEHLFSSFLLDEERFPSYPGTPAQRLRGLNDHVKSLGWRGIGIWVACQSHLEQSGKPFSWDQTEHFWQERLEWCEYAGVEYIKVDWGARCADIEYRRRLSELAREVCPSGVMEHAYPCRPLNDFFASARYAHWKSVPAAFAQIASNSDVFRVYDSCPQLSISTTIDRCSGLLQNLSNDSGCQLNCEDELYVAAGLGLCVGSMRWERVQEWDRRADPRNLNCRSNELRRALAWFRLAQPFSNNEVPGGITESDRILFDDWSFEAGDFWWSELDEKTAMQAATAVCSRNMPLPVVLPDERGELPFVLACRYPNGATALSFLPRLSSDRGVYFPHVNAEIAVQDLAAPLGLFGQFSSVTIRCDGIDNGSRLFLRDLLQTQETDITDEVVFEEGEAVIPYRSVERHSRFDQHDPSDIGVVLCFRK